MKDTKVIPSTLAASVVTTLVNAFAEGINTAKNSGRALVTFCQAAAKAKLPITPNDSDVIVIVNALAAKLGWDAPTYKRSKQAKSEARAIVRQHAYLPEAMDALIRSEHGACGYHDVVSVARLIKSEGNVKAAIKAFNSSKPPKATDTGKRFELALQAHYQTVSESKSKSKSAQLNALRAVAQTFGFEAIKS
jgi:hypothetical protein